MSTVSGSLVGLALSQSLILTGMVQYGMRQFADVVSQVTSVERIMEYVQIENEESLTLLAGLLLLQYRTLVINKKLVVAKKPPSKWPSNGEIVFSEVSLFYSPMDPPVLKNLSFTINSNHKVSIIVFKITETTSFFSNI